MPLILEKQQKISKLLEAKSLTDIDYYTKKGSKTEGITSGYIAEKDDHTYMIKDSNSFIKASLTEKEISEKNDFLSEFVVAPLYKRILFDRAPEIGISKSKDSGNLFLRSKFVENFSELGQHIGSAEVNILGLKKVEGFEKTIAASIFLADPDYHNQNLGITSKDSNEHLAVKIDHGRSLGENSSSSDDLMVNFVNRRIRYGYDNIEFDIYKFNQAANSITQISDAEIENCLESQTYKLQRYGFMPEAIYYDQPIHTPIIYADSPSNNEISFSTIPASKILIKLKDQPESFVQILDNQVVLIKDGKEPEIVPNMSRKDLKLLSVSIKRGGQGDNEDMITKKMEFLKSLGDLGLIDEKKYRFSALNEHIVDKVKAQKRFFQELKAKTTIIEKIDADLLFKKGQWVSEFFLEKPSKNPISYALENGLTIEGKSPVEWVIKNDKNIEKKLIIDFLTTAIKDNNIEAIKEYASYRKNIAKDYSLLDLAKIHGSKELNDELKKIQNKENLFTSVELPRLLTKEIKKLSSAFRENHLPQRNQLNKLNPTNLRE